MDEKRENAEVIDRLAVVLDNLGIRYAIGGSVASALYGTVRFTRDADITIQPFPSLADRLYELLKNEFYVRRQAMEEALDFKYLSDSARELGLEELLDRAIAEAQT